MVGNSLANSVLMECLERILSPARVHAKICGITRIEDALAAVASGADAIGLVFYDKSSRFVDTGLAAEICRYVPPFVTTVGLFVNAGSQAVEQVLAQVPLKLLQFHGDEEEPYCASFGRPYIKALHVSSSIAVGEASDAGQFTGASQVHAQLLERIACYPRASGFLFDTEVSGARGGTGKMFDWTLVPAGVDRPVILAGGLNPDNVGAAIETSRPYAVDVSSGVESAPGIKDADKIRHFMRQVQLSSAKN